MFEGKHGYFKDIACRLKCRKNILLTLAKKHQYYQCWHLHNNSSLLHSCDISGYVGKQVETCVLPSHAQSLLVPVTVGNSTVFQANSVDVDGSKFECGLARITGIHMVTQCFQSYVGCSLSIGNSTLLQTNLRYYQHFHAYCAVYSQHYHLMPPADIHDPFPVPIYETCDTNARACIVLRYGISVD